MDQQRSLPSRNRYLLTIVDEYSCFPFAFPYSNMTAEKIIRCLNQLFVVFGMPVNMHSDRRLSFLSKELKEYLTKRGIAVSRTTPYNPQGNEQYERFNGITRKFISQAVASRGRPESQWEQVLLEVLYLIISCGFRVDNPPVCWTRDWTSDL